MSNQAVHDNLLGLFSTLFATRRGRKKPTAADRKDAAVIADQTLLNFDYRLNFGAGGDKGARSKAGKAALSALDE